ncbi:MAG: hypothetical protein EOO47_15275 [Flavobacterium sp.]|nr:MAG: hypothetical protein EOO47_15275 [Flavobacterium sp.]
MSFNKKFFLELLINCALAIILSIIVVKIIFIKESSGLEGGQGIILINIFNLILCIPALIVASISSLAIGLEKNITNEKKFRNIYFIPVLIASTSILIVSFYNTFEDMGKLFLAPLSLCIAYNLLWIKSYRTFRKLYC